MLAGACCRSWFVIDLDVCFCLEGIGGHVVDNLVHGRRASGRKYSLLVVEVCCFVTQSAGGGLVKGKVYRHGYETK